MSRPVDIPNPAAGPPHLSAAAVADIGPSPTSRNSPTTASILAALRRDLALSPNEAAQRGGRGGGRGGRGGGGGEGGGARAGVGGAGGARGTREHDDDDDDEEEEDDEAGGGAEPPTTQQHPPPPADFSPFYTLITDPTTGAHAHPRAVHYLFADDPDAAILTDALLAHMPVVTGDKPKGGNRGKEEEEGEQEDGREAAPPQDHRIVIVDVALDGREVLNVASLSPDWQALTASVAPAPSWRGGGGGGEEQQQQAGGLMLKIAGSEVVGDVARDGEGKRRVKGTSASAAAAAAQDEVEGLLKEFDARLGDLDRVLVVAGEEEDGDGEEQGEEEGAAAGGDGDGEG